MDTTVMKKAAPVCSCGKTGELKAFATFEYFFCTRCKVEIGGKVVEKPKIAQNIIQEALDDPWTNFRLHAIPGQQRLDPTAVAFTGDVLSCEACGAKVGEVIADIPTLSLRPLVPIGTFYPYIKMLTSPWHQACCLAFCGATRIKRRSPAGAQVEYFVKGRGWV